MDCVHVDYEGEDFPRAEELEDRGYAPNSKAILFEHPEQKDYPVPSGSHRFESDSPEGLMKLRVKRI